MTRLEKIWCAVQHVKRARDLLRQAECGNAADYCARTLKSVEGAERHAKGVAARNTAVRVALKTETQYGTVPAASDAPLLRRVVLPGGCVINTDLLPMPSRPCYAGLDRPGA